MDRPQGNLAPYLAATETPSPGWDAHSVWHDRVHSARGSSAAPSGGTPTISLPASSSGWDPAETWRVRVQRPRRATR